MFFIFILTSVIGGLFGLPGVVGFDGRPVRTHVDESVVLITPHGGGGGGVGGGGGLGGPREHLNGGKYRIIKKMYK